MVDEQRAPEDAPPDQPPQAEPNAAEPGADAVQRVYAPSGGAHAETLALASAAFVRGDFKELRARCKAVVASGDQASASERAFAADLLRRTAVDPWALGVAAALVALIVGLFIHAY